jgi:2,3-dihydroxyphenylpropionate 1,2-dioxygenase
VPLFVNCAAPPLPSLARSAALGAAVGRALDAFPDGRRIAVLGSGGLSHQVPLPAWNDLDPADGEKYRTFVTGNTEDETAEVERLRIKRVLSMLGTAETWTDEELDREVLSDLLGGRLESVTGRSQPELVARGGTGMNEVRTWLAAYAAAGAVGGELYGYATVGNWLTGMGVVRYQLPKGARR